jgi:hypothetical protein
MKLPANYLYLRLDDEEREALYQQWCRTAKLDPALDYSVEEFFSVIDNIKEEDTEE